jgi:hypothetical protein
MTMATKNVVFTQTDENGKKISVHMLVEISVQVTEVLVGDETLTEDEWINRFGIDQDTLEEIQEHAARAGTAALLEG